MENIFNIIGNNYNTILITLIGLIFSGIIIALIPIILKRQDKELFQIKEPDLGNDSIKKVDNDLDKETLSKDIFNLYKKQEIAKSKYDYETLKEILTNDLYKKEEEKLKLKQKEKNKIVKTNINLHELKILEIKKENNIETILASLYISQYDYLLNNKKELIRGSDKDVYQIELRLTIEKDLMKNLKIKNKQITGKWIKNYK